MQESQWLRDKICGIMRQHRLPHGWIIFWYKTVPKDTLLLNFFGVDTKYAKHLRAYGEMCVVADKDNKVGRTKIDPRCKISLYVGYSTQHAGDVYRLLNRDS